MSTFSWLSFAKPGFRDRYDISSRRQRQQRKSPVGIGRKCSEKFVAVFLASTIAPATTAPCSSETVPWIVPDVMSWAKAPTDPTDKRIRQKLILKNQASSLLDIIFLLRLSLKPGEKHSFARNRKLRLKIWKIKRELSNCQHRTPFLIPCHANENSGIIVRVCRYYNP